jgi:hypothetical protein
LNHFTVPIAMGISFVREGTHADRYASLRP